MAICAITGTVYDQSGVVSPDARLVITPLSVSGILMSSHSRVVKAVAGVVTFDEVQGTVVRIEGNVLGYTADDGANVLIPSSPTATLEGLTSVTTIPTTGLTILDEGVALSGLYGTINLVGSGVVATQASPGVATLTITAGGGSGTVTSVSVVTANGISGSVATATTTPAITLTVQDAAADGATKGIAAFLAADFNSSAGVISLDYTNAQKATGSLPGLLTAADWTTFNGKQAPATTLAGYGITDAVPNTRTVNGKALSSNITLGLASADYANQGTTTTVLHGNAAGNPSFAAVSLTADVSGILPAANGGFGADVSGSSGVPLFATGTPTFTSTSGSGNFVRVTSATLVTPALGTPTALVLTSATGLPPTTGIVGWPANASGVLTNNGSGTLSWGAAGGGLTIGTTTITSGTTTRILYDNAGTLGEYTITGTGTVVAMQAGPTFTGTLAAAAITASGVITQTSASATAFESGPNGGTNPVLRLVNSTASQADGVSITGLAAGGGVTFTALSSGSNAPITLTPKGTGGVLIGDGTAANPALAFASATGTGIWQNVGGFAFSAAGTQFALFKNTLFQVGAGITIGWGNSFTAPDAAFSRNAAGVVEVNNGVSGTGGALLVRGAGAINGQALTINSASELLTLSTGGLTTDTSANLLPAGAIILSVTCRVTTTITTTTNWAVGDPTTAARFSAANATLTAGTTSIGLDHLSGAVATLAAGPTQAAAAKVRITCTGANPGAGAIRITVHYILLGAPSS